MREESYVGPKASHTGLKCRTIPCRILAGQAPPTLLGIVPEVRCLEKIEKERVKPAVHAN